MERRRLLALLPFSLAAMAAPPALAQLASAPPSTAQDQADIARVTAYLNTIHTLKARFLQTDASGAVSGGDVWLQRPGRMRFQYDAPKSMLLVAGHGLLVYYDPAVRQTTNIFLSSTPLGLLLQDNLTLHGDVTVTGIARSPGQLQVTLIRSARPNDGAITLVFVTDRLTLKSWLIRDAQGRVTQVSLYDITYGGTFAQNLFTFVGPQFNGK